MTLMARLEASVDSYSEFDVDGTGTRPTADMDGKILGCRLNSALLAESLTFVMNLRIFGRSTRSRMTCVFVTSTSLSLDFLTMSLATCRPGLSNGAA